MAKRSVIALCMLFVTMPLWADSIDEAEAKRRGVPVAQVVAENALAKEKAKTAALEKQIADLQKKIAEFSGPSGTASGPAAATGTPASPAAPIAPTVAAAALNFDGPRESSPLYDDLVNRYLTGDWTTLTADFAAKQKEIAALPAGNLADLTYIKQALAECRPVWWDQAKAGKPVQFRATVFKQSMPINFQNGPAAKFGAFTGGAYTLNWPADHMDARDPLALPDAGLNIAGDHGFIRGDGVDYAVWNLLGGIALGNQVGQAKVKAFTAGEKSQFDRYAGFLQNVVSGYYGTPQTRRLVMLMSCASFESGMDGNLGWATRRPLGAAVMIEIATHHDRYKNLHVEPILGLGQVGNGGGMESFLAKPVTLQLLDMKFTLDEDRHLRDVIKALADDNPNWNVPKLNLPGGLHFDLNPANDGPNANDRVAVYNGGSVHSDKPPQMPGAAQ